MVITEQIESYDDMNQKAWELLENNASSRKSIKLIKALSSEERKPGMEASYLILRYIDDVVDSKIPMDMREGYLNDLEKELNNPEIDAAYVLKSDIAKKLLQTNKLSPNDRTKTLVNTFKSLYGSGAQQEELLGGFFAGMKEDLKLDKDTSYLFNDDELKNYYTQIQTNPIFIGMISAGIDVHDEVGNEVGYDEFYAALDNVSQGIMMLKGVRGKELIEDAELGRVYFSKEELEEVGIKGPSARSDFLKLIDPNSLQYGKSDQIRALVNARVKRTHEYFRAAEDAVMGLKDGGPLDDVKRYIVAYGINAKVWAEKLSKHDYQPLDPEGGFFDLEMGKLQKYSTFGRLKTGLGIKGLYESVTDWKLKNKGVQAGKEAYSSGLQLT